jgi:hypothetical protein
MDDGRVIISTRLRNLCCKRFLFAARKQLRGEVDCENGSMLGGALGQVSGMGSKSNVYGS